MYSPNLEVGSTFLYRGQVATMDTCGSKYLVLEIEGHSSPSTIRIEEFYKDIKDGLVQEAEPQLILAEQYQLTTPEDRSLAKRYEDYITPLLSEAYPGSKVTRQRVINSVAANRGDHGKNKPSQSTLYIWYTKFISPEVNRNFAAMVKPRPKKTGRQATSWVRDLFHDTVNTHYLKPVADGALNRRETFDKFDRAFDRALSQIPEDEKKSVKGICRSVCYEMLEDYNPVDVCIAREGYSSAVKRYRSSTEHFVAERPLELVQIDAVHLNLAIRNDAGQYVGMVVVFFAIDVCTRSILGYTISVAKQRREELSSAIDLIKSVICPKQKPSHTNNEWPLYGIPEKIQHDSGIFASHHFKAFLQEAGIQTYQNPAGRSWFNALIERFHRTFREQCCKKIPGYVGRRNDETKDSVNIKATPYVTSTQLQSLIEAYILDQYHQNPHKGLEGKTPQEKCDQLRCFLRPPSPSVVQQLDSFRGILHKGTIQAHKGIQHNNLFYMDSNGQLQRLWENLGGRRNRKNPVVEFYSSALDISEISVLDPFTKTRFSVPCTKIKTRTSLAEHKARQPLPTKRGAHSKEMPQSMTSILSDINEYKVSKEEQKAQKKRARKSRNTAASAQIDPECTNNKLSEELDHIIDQNLAGINEPPPIMEEKGEASFTQKSSRKRSKKAFISKFEV
jgi:putative transposase